MATRDIAANEPMFIIRNAALVNSLAARRVDANVIRVRLSARNYAGLVLRGINNAYDELEVLANLPQISEAASNTEIVITLHRSMICAVLVADRRVEEGEEISIQRFR